MSILPVGIGPQEGGYQIERSLRFNSADSAYLSRTPASAGNRKTWTWSGWVKRSAISSGFPNLFGAGSGTSAALRLMFKSDDYIILDSFGAGEIRTAAQFRDPSSYYHVVVAFNTTEATGSNRVKIWVNNSQQTLTFGYTPALNSDYDINNTVAHAIGRNTANSSDYFNGYLTEVNFIDGQALDPTSFGEYNSDTGVWQPKAYTGSYGTNGFYLDFADNSSTTALGYDAAGSNDWTPNNFSVTAGSGNDSLVDTPTNYGTDTGVGGEVRGNYCTWNAVSGYAVTLTNGNLDYTTGTSSNPVTSTWSLPTSGKWYWEVTVSSVAEAMIGIQTRNNLAYAGPKTAYYRQGGSSNSIYIEGSANAYNASSYTNGDVIAVGYDADNSQIRWYKNNVQQGGPYTLTSLDNLTPIIIQASGSGSTSGVANFGQRPFAYAAPTGFKALCTQNLPEPTVVDGSTAMNVVTYTGTGSTRSVTGVGFQPDFTWLKERSNVRNHYLYDVVRGPLKELYSNLTSAESSNTIGLSAFDSDGFTINSGDNAFNGTGNSYVAWNWKAGGTGVTNTAGSITSTVSANTTAGFSIVTYTGTGANATVGHGLGIKPGLMIFKSRNNAGSAADWMVYHSSLGATKNLRLQSTAAEDTQTAVFNNTEPTTTVFTVGTNNNINASGGTMLTYCFAPVAGYSAFGSYTGNGSADGPFVYTGFRPRYIMLKCSSTSGLRWNIFDTSRSPYNVGAQTLYADSSAAEDSGTGADYDILSNGFKLRSTNSNPNTSGATYIYAAFAENPFKYSLAR